MRPFALNFELPYGISPEVRLNPLDVKIQWSRRDPFRFKKTIARTLLASYARKGKMIEPGNYRLTVRMEGTKIYHRLTRR